MGSRALSCPPTPLWCLDPSLTLGLLSVSFLSPRGLGHIQGHSLGKQWAQVAPSCFIPPGSRLAVLGKTGSP